ncbi:hypothetical protein [uncultured Draconibacterium sp.]|uniref:hypothetical protein n=1 Tax=uncultured Draconibacterium sp. TaxID=1573823 RepID=UPI00325FF20D
MKQLIGILIFTLAAFSCLQSNAQKDNEHQDRWERYRTEKVAFLTTTLDLTPEEAQKFWPVYNEMEKLKADFQRKRREMESEVRDAEGKLSDKEMIALTRAHVAVNKDEANLHEKYNEQFLKILPPVKVIKLYKAENEFRMHMFKKYREKRRSDEERK